MMEKASFGPAGRPDSFAALGYKKTEELADYVHSFGLGAFEYQFGRGVRYQEGPLRELGRRSKELGILLSAHAPYYISLSSPEKEKRENSIAYILETAKAAAILGADRIVVHSGSCSKQSREEALALAKDTLCQALGALENQGFSGITLCPETMGKLNQLGDLEEVLSFCEADERLLPCIDFGHLNARTLGGVKDREDYAAILDALENRLGADRAGRFHAHFSKIEYTEKGGEKRHLTFADQIYGPDPRPLMALVAERGWTPRFICESAGTQAEDAKAMMEEYQCGIRNS